MAAGYSWILDFGSVSYAIKFLQQLAHFLSTIQFQIDLKERERERKKGRQAPGFSGFSAFFGWQLILILSSLVADFDSYL